MYQVVIVGSGPRGCYAAMALQKKLHTNKLNASITLIDQNHLFGGAIYSPQPDYLIMNTTADQVTAFPDDEPHALTLHQWADKANKTTRLQHGYPPRVMHGEYIKWAVQHTLDLYGSPNIHFKTVRDSVIDIIDQKGIKKVVCKSSRILDANAVLLALGNVCLPLQARKRLYSKFPKIEKAKLHALDKVLPKTCLGIVGLGLGFFDAVTHLSLGRGGKFHRDPGTKSLYYTPSGLEPYIFGFSRTGVPLRARGVNQKPANQCRTPQFISTNWITSTRVKNRGTLELWSDVIPIIKKEMLYEFDRISYIFHTRRQYHTLIRHVFAERYLDRRSPALWGSSLIKFLEYDLDESLKGNQTSPIKASTDILRDIRDACREMIEHGGIDNNSRDTVENKLMSRYNSICVGPPAFRIEQLIALAKAGIVNLNYTRSNLQGMDLVFNNRKFLDVEKMDHIVDSRWTAKHSVLLRRLYERRSLRRYKYAPGSTISNRVEVTKDNYIVRANGTVDEKISLVGPATEGSTWFTQVAARPGVGSRALSDADLWATMVINNIQS